MSIYTIGYQNLTRDRLREIVIGLKAVLFDVRHVPRSRKAGFGGNQLRELLGARYNYAGMNLGGRGHVNAAGIEMIKTARYPLILMCLEAAPGDCHRHHDICSKHFPDAIHIFEDELFTARALDEAIAAGPHGEYDLIGSLSDFIE